MTASPKNQRLVLVALAIVALIGATLLVDAETGRVRYAIHKRLDDEARRERQRQFMSDVKNQSLYATYSQDASDAEPFAILHRF